MSDISKIELPSGNSYNLKDNKAVASFSVDANTVTYKKRDNTEGTFDLGKKFFVITEDMVTVSTDATKGVAPYSASYGYTNIDVNPDMGVVWEEGAVYIFVINTKMVVASATRNVRIRIGSDDSWHPVMEYSTSICPGSSWFVKAMTVMFQFKSVYQTAGALHRIYDANTTYAYLVNTIPAGATKIDANGYGARYSLAFATTPIGSTDERYSSLVTSSGSGSTKAVPNISKFYLDRRPQYIASANIAAGAVSANSLYQDYTGIDLRYVYNTNATYLTVNSKVFLWLKDFDTNDMSFKADNTVGNIMSKDKIATRFPASTSGSVYLLFLGWNTATWYSLTRAFTEDNVIYKYTPSTGSFELLDVNARKDGTYPDMTVGNANHASNADTVNNYTVNKSVPVDAKFTDTTYSAVTQSANGLMTSSDKMKLDGFQTAANYAKTNDLLSLGTRVSTLESGGQMPSFGAVTTAQINTILNKY